MLSYEEKVLVMKELVEDVEYRNEFSNQIVNWVKEYKSLEEQNNEYLKLALDGLFTFEEVEKKIESNSKRLVKILNMVVTRVM